MPKWSNRPDGSIQKVTYLLRSVEEAEMVKSTPRKHTGQTYQLRVIRRAKKSDRTHGSILNNHIPPMDSKSKWSDQPHEASRNHVHTAGEQRSRNGRIILTEASKTNTYHLRGVKSLSRVHSDQNTYILDRNGQIIIT